jgi:hypothetical protein
MMMDDLRALRCALEAFYARFHGVFGRSERFAVGEQVRLHEGASPAVSLRKRGTSTHPME